MITVNFHTLEKFPIIELYTKYFKLRRDKHDIQNIFYTSKM